MVDRSFILTYHSIDRSGSVISVTPEEFRSHMELLAHTGRQVVPLCDLSSRPGAVAISFDDGFRSFHEHAFRILAERRFPATVFVVTGHCGGQNNWSSQANGVVPTMNLMGWREIQELADEGIGIGSHTVTHPRLTDIGCGQARQELRDSRRTLEDRLGCAIDTFAYPYGCMDAGVREIVASEFRLACGTGLDFVTDSSDVLCLPRLDMYYLRRPQLFRLLLRGSGGELYVQLRRGLRNLRGYIHA